MPGGDSTYVAGRVVSRNWPFSIRAITGTVIGIAGGIGVGALWISPIPAASPKISITVVSKALAILILFSCRKSRVFPDL